MPDLAMCDNQFCEKRTTCYRNEASGTKPKEHWQSWSIGPLYDGKDCEVYIPVEKENERRK